MPSLRIYCENEVHDNIRNSHGTKNVEKDLILHFVRIVNRWRNDIANDPTWEDLDLTMIEVLWPVIRRAHGAADIGLEILYSVGSPKQLPDSKDFVDFVKANMLSILQEMSKKLWYGVSYSVWVRPQKDASFDIGRRGSQVKTR